MELTPVLDWQMHQWKPIVHMLGIYLKVEFESFKVSKDKEILMFSVWAGRT